MTDEMVRFELGFRNGGSTGGSLPEDEWKKLEDALKSGGSALVELAGSRPALAPAGRGGRLGAPHPELPQARLRAALTDARADPVLLALARLRRPGLTRVVAAYSRLGDNGIGWVVAGVVLALALGRPWRAVAVAALIWATLGLNYAIKHLLRRERPPLGGPVEPLIGAPTSPSFPSSHAAMSAAAVFGLSELVPEAWPLFATLAVLMALSRLYLAVHYTVDVVAGAVLGTAAGAAYLLLA